MQVDPAVLRDAQLPRLRHAGQQQRRALVDVGVGAHQPGVGVGNHRVAGRSGGDLFGAAARAPVGQRVGCGHRRKAGQQCAHRGLVLGQAQAPRRAQRMFDQRVHGDGSARAMAVFGIRPAAPVNAPGGGAAARSVGPVQRHAAAHRSLLRGQGFGADHQRGADLAPRHAFGQAVDAPLRHVAAGLGVDELPRLRGAQALRDRLGRVARTTEGAGKAVAGVGKLADHDHAVQRPQQGRSGAAVVCRRAGGGGHQVQRRQRGARVRLSLRDLAAAHQHRHALVAAGAGDHAHFPVHRGARFSMKASGPSL